MKKYFAIISVGFCVLAGYGFYSYSQSKRVDVTRPIRGQAVRAVYATGTVEPSIMMPLSPHVSSRIVKLLSDEGAVVKKGQILAEMESDELKYLIQQLKSRGEFAKKEFERNESLLKKKTISQKMYDQSKADMQTAIAATLEAQAKFDYLNIKAPADGLLIKRDGEEGQFIPAGEAIFWMSENSPLRITAEVDEEDIASVKVGQKVLIRADAFIGKVFHGKVQQITPKGDPVARSYRVRVGFTDDNPLKIGMTTETNIITNEQDDAQLIPSGAINDSKVWLVEDGKLKNREVVVGAKGVELTEIEDELPKDSLVVIKSNKNFKEGQSVSVNVIETEIKTEIKE
ncbi:MAG: efflux RND transporter periplasmic adaptor subunit [Rickettsiales bacterium]